MLFFVYRNIISFTKYIKMKFIDVFCGMGAFHRALQEMGHECVFACDIDKGARKIYEANYGVRPHGDIRKIQNEEIPAHDILCAGFPYQSFNNTDEDNVDQGTLIKQILRILKHHQPKYAILENVKNLCIHDQGRTLLSILDMLDECGYYTKWNVLNAIYFGVPQCRERVYFVCYRKDISCPFSFSQLKHVDKIPCIRDIIEPSQETDMTEALSTKYDICAVDRKPRANGSKPFMIKELYSKSSKKGGGQGQRIYSIDYPGITICSGSGGVGGSTGLYQCNETIRTLTPIETFRMFGFPDTFMYPCSARRIISYMGNSICVPVLRAIFTELFRHQDSSQA